MGESPGRRLWPSGALGQAIVVLVGVALAAVVVIGLLGEPEAGSRWHEARNVTIQLLGLVVIGAVVTLATDRFQQAAADRQRSADQESEARQRLADRASDFVAQLLTAYHGVKQVRRDLQAMSQAGGKAPEHREAMAKELAQLSVHQLEFEWLAERVRLLEPRIGGPAEIEAPAEPRENAPDDAPAQAESWSPAWMRALPAPGTMSEHLTMVEKNLKRVIESKGPVEWGKTEGVGVFVETWHFRMCVTRHVRAVQGRMEEYLLRE